MYFNMVVAVIEFKVKRATWIVKGTRLLNPPLC